MIKGSVAILFWDERRLWLGSGGLKCENSVPKFERKPTQTTGVVRLTPNFVDPKLCGPLVMFINHGLHQKSHVSGHLLRRPPLVNSLPKVP